MNINIKTKHNIGDKIFVLIRDDGRYQIREENITAIEIGIEQENEWDTRKDFPIIIKYRIGNYCWREEPFIIDDIKNAKRLCNKLNKFLNYL